MNTTSVLYKITDNSFGNCVYSFRACLLSDLKVSHPRCVVKIQVHEEYPICVQSQNTTVL